MAYVTNIYSKNVLRGEDYSIYKTIQINLSYGMNDTEKLRIYKPIDILHLNDYKTFVDDFEIYEFNMDKIIKEWYNDCNEEEKYLVMLGLEKEELEKFSKSTNDRLVNKYMEELNNLNNDDDFYFYMTKEESIKKQMNSERYYGMKQGLEQGLEKGLEQGMNQKSIEIAKNLLNMNMTIENIMKATSLTKEEIEKIKGI